MWEPRLAVATLVRFHRGCRPDGAPGEVACAGCGDGPLLAGELAHPTDLLTYGAVEGWLRDTGWRVDPHDPRHSWCPTCAGI